jgi:acetyltransferase-like isoleucine patch superfamily enzyme
MFKSFKIFFNKIATKIYLAGKLNYETALIKSLYCKGKIDPSVHFNLSADLQNLSKNKNSITIGKQTNIEGLLLVYAYGGKIKIGDFCSLSPNSRIISTDNISIGNRVLIAHNVNIIDNNSHPVDAALRHQDFVESFTIGMQPHDLNAAPIIIEDDVWIGHNTTILKGVKIGKGAIIGACSIVTKDVAPFTVNVGNPLRVIKYLIDEEENKSI